VPRGRVSGKCSVQWVCQPARSSESYFCLLRQQVGVQVPRASLLTAFFSAGWLAGLTQA
jgi:hypothetical protein